MSAFLLVFILLIALYLIAIMPQLKKSHTMLFLKRYYFAHRGLHENGSDAPENSLLAYQHAVEAGYGIELDVQLSKDLVPVVFHDYNLKRMCQIDKKVSELTFAELCEIRLLDTAQTIPSLEMVLSLVNGQVPLIIECKVERADCSVCSYADSLLSSYQGTYCIESFNPLVLYWYRKHRPEIVRGQLSTNFLREGHYSLIPLCIQHLLFNFFTKPSFVAYNCIDKATLSRRLCRDLYRNPSVAWTIHSPKELSENKRSFDLFIFEGFRP